jgi:hypothetical protein
MSLLCNYENSNNTFGDRSLHVLSSVKSKMKNEFELRSEENARDE